MVVRYPTTHEKDIPHRPLRLRMGSHRTSSPCPQSLRTTSGSPSTRDPKRYLLHRQKWLCLAAFAPRLRTPWKTVHHYFRIWRLDGVWERLNKALRERLRVRQGRNPHPSAGMVDSQSAKTTGVGGEARGYDGGKKIRGRKRHLLVDTEGLVLKAKVHSAKVPDQDGIKLVLKTTRDRFPHLSHLWVDAGYRGRGKEWVEKELGLSVEVVHRTPKPAPEKIARIWAEEWSKEGRQIDWQKLLPRRRGFEVLPRRWVVERTFSWLSQNRRMSKDYERLCSTSESFVYAAMSRLMVRRLVRV
jgi:putative transposase